MIAQTDRWSELLAWVHEAQQSLPLSQPSPRKQGEYRDVAEHFFALDEQYRKQVDAAAHELSATGTMPQIEGDVWRCLMMRLECAQDFLNQLLIRREGRAVVPQPDTRLTNEALRSWLLCELWHEWRRDA